MLFLAGVYFSREIRISCFRIDNYSVQVVYVHRNSKFLSFMFGSKALCVCGGGGLNIGTQKSMVLGGSELGSNVSSGMYQL